MSKKVKFEEKIRIGIEATPKGSFTVRKEFVLDKEEDIKRIFEFVEMIYKMFLNDDIGHFFVDFDRCSVPKIIEEED